jgi:GNAT superfamily N-acetyltransferase
MTRPGDPDGGAERPTQTEDDAALLERALRFMAGVEDRSATRHLPSPIGTLLLNDVYPESYAHNFLRVVGPRPGLDAATFIAEAERLTAEGRTGLSARVADHATGRRLEPALTAAGWMAVCLIVMVWSDDGSPRPTLAEVAPWERVRPLVEAFIRAEPYGSDPEVVRQLVDRREAVAGATHLRDIAAPAGGPYASTTELRSDGRTAEIEFVRTLREHRNQGLAAAVVRFAAQLARDEGHDLIFLVADEGDWPKHLYERLGFRTVGRCWEFERNG